MSRTVGGVRSLLYPKPETLSGWEFYGLGEGVRYVLSDTLCDRVRFGGVAF